MVVVTTAARQPLANAQDNTRANEVLHDVTNYLESNKLLVHNVESATMAHNAPPLHLCPREPPTTQ